MKRRIERHALAVAVAYAMMGPAPPAAAAPRRSAASADPTDSARACPAEEGCGSLAGRVRAEGRRTPVGAARVVVIPGGPPPDAASAPAWALSTTTDDDGRFSIAGIPAGSVRVVVLAEGHARLERDVVLGAEDRLDLELFAAADDADLYRTVVAGRRSVQDGRPPSTLLSREEIETLPGTQGDALRALQNLPGVARPPGGLGFLVLRGASPSQSLTMVGEHPVPRAFHSLPLAGVVQADALDEVELVPSNVSPRYGPLLGGLVRLAPRRPRRDATHGHGKIDLMGIDAEVDGPMGRASYLVAARRGWADAVLKAAEPIAEQGFVLPGLWDYQSWVVIPVRRAELEVRALGAGDRVRSRYFDYQRDEIVDAFDFRAQFHRFDLVLRHHHDHTAFLLTPSLRIAQNKALWPEIATIERRELAPGWRSELDTRVAPRARLVIGTDGEIVPYRYSEQRRRNGGPPTADDTTVRGVDTRAGVYALLHLGTGRWRVSPGVRLQATWLAKNPAAAIDPRLAIRWAPSDRVALDFGVGHYSLPYVDADLGSAGLVQNTIRDVAPTVAVPSGLIEAFEPTIVTADTSAARIQTAEQASVTLEVSLPWDLDLRLAAFGRYFFDPGAIAPPLVSRGPPVEVPGSKGVDAGGELLLRRRLSRNLYGWISYTVMRSLRWSEDRRFPSSFDQPHHLLVVASYRLPRGWRVGGRFRVSSGNPVTPIVGSVDLPNNIYFGTSHAPLYGPFNSDRFPAFHQLDLRLDKQWTRPRATINAYLDVQNVYNRQNVEAWVYQADYRGRIGSVGLPIFPTLGVRVDF